MCQAGQSWIAHGLRRHRSCVRWTCLFKDVKLSFIWTGGLSRSGLAQAVSLEGSLASWSTVSHRDCPGVPPRWRAWLDHGSPYSLALIKDQYWRSPATPTRAPSGLNQSVQVSPCFTAGCRRACRCDSLQRRLHHVFYRLDVEIRFVDPSLPQDMSDAHTLGNGAPLTSPDAP